MAEPTLTLGYDDFAGETGYYLGWGRDKTVWDASQTADLAVIVNAGMRTFLNPPSLAENEPPHIWSFLFEAATVSLTSADFDYDLPENFGGGVQWFTYAASVVKKTIEIVPYDQLLALRANNNASGDPTIAAIHRKTFSATTGERYEAVFYPTPNASRTITYTFLIRPAKLDTTNKYAYGSANHSETILAACLAIAEMRRNDGQKGPLWEHWVECLKTSIQRDKVNMPITRAFPWSQTEPSDLQATYQALQYILGDYLGFGPDPATWKTPEVHKAHTAIQNGLRRFYFPEPVEGKGRYLWTFMNPVSRFDLITGQSVYDMPTDYSGMNAPFTILEVRGENDIPWQPPDPDTSVIYDLGPEILSDPTFQEASASTPWSFGSHWSLDEDNDLAYKETDETPPAGFLYQNQDDAVDGGDFNCLYLVEFRLTDLSGCNVRVLLGDNWGGIVEQGNDWDGVGNGTKRSASGSYRELLSSCYIDRDDSSALVDIAPSDSLGVCKIREASIKKLLNPDEVVILGQECLTNYDMTDDEGWTYSGAWSWDATNHKFVRTASADNPNLYQASDDMALAVEVGSDKVYQLTFTVTRTAGTLDVYLNDPGVDASQSWLGEISASGTYTWYVGERYAAETLGLWFIADETFAGTITAVSLKPITAYYSESFS